MADLHAKLVANGQRLVSAAPRQADVSTVGPLLREPLATVDALHFLRLGKALTDYVRSAEYINTIMLAANLTPRDRSELLLTVTKMVQVHVDQDNALSLLSHSVEVSQTFAHVHRAQPTDADAAADAPAAQQQSLLTCLILNTYYSSYSVSY